MTVTGSVAADRTNIIFYDIDGAAAKQMSVYGYNHHTTPLMLDDRWLAWLDVPGAGAKSSPDAPRRLRLYDRWRLPLGVSVHEEYPELVVEYTAGSRSNGGSTKRSPNASRARRLPSSHPSSFGHCSRWAIFGKP